MFDETAETYDDQINKLLGFVDCNSQVHVNSARFGWKWNKDCVAIYAYVYQNGVRIEPFHIADIDINEWYDYSLILGTNYYSFTVNGYGVAIPRQTSCNKGFHAMLWPYYGGQATAPHDIYIRIKL